MTTYGTATEAAIARVTEACTRYGKTSVVALAGVPGTGKSFIAAIAAQRFTGEPLLVQPVQFHRSFTYEEFIEGLRLDLGGAVEVRQGVLLDWNEKARNDPDQKYVVLIDELTRGDITAVLGEALTYLEHRDRTFTTLYGRQPAQFAQNLVVLATYNPTDRSALELDDALIRRMRIISFPPDTAQLREMLSGANLSDECMNALAGLFDTCKTKFPGEYEALMPFGHGLFSEVLDEQPDLSRLWEERIRHLLQRPSLDPHPFKAVIEEAYPWRDPEYMTPGDD